VVGTASDVGSESQSVGEGTCVAARVKHQTRGEGGGRVACEGAMARD